MRTNNNNRKSKLLAFLLSAMMLSSAGALFAACKDADDSSSSDSTDEEATTEETLTDDGIIKNANFDFTTLSTKNVIGKSVTGWTSSVNSNASGSANASKAVSGVIDTSESGWKYLTARNFTDDQLKAMSDADAVAQWANFSAQDKLSFYTIWKAKDENKDKTISTDFSAYEALNIDEEDVPTVANPGTRTLTAEETAAGKTLDSNVLMLHNLYYNSTSEKNKPVGTAQKFTSSSTVTVPAGSSAKFSVWVKTADLKSASSGNASTQDAIGKGAYISVKHSVGGKSLDAYEVKNINTETMDLAATNGWAQYTFYIQGSYYADTTFSLILGLGQGTTNDRLDYVNGYAFFDDIQCEIIENSEFASVTADYTCSLDDEKDAKTVDIYKDSDANVFAMNFHKEWENVFDDYTLSLNADLNELKTKSSDGSSKNPDVNAKDKVQLYSDHNAIKNDIVGNEYLTNVYEYAFADKGADDKYFIEDNDVLLFLSTNGTAYTAEKALTFTLASGDKYMAVSFFVKAYANGGTAANVTLVDGLEKTSFSAIDTSELPGVKVGDDEDAYDGWQQISFFVERDEEVDITDAISFSLTFNYGPTDITSAMSEDMLAQGFAAFTKFTYVTGMSEIEYEAASTGTYSKKVTIKGTQDEKAAGNSGFDTAAGVPDNALETGFAHLQNYKGVYSDNYRVSLPTANESDTDKRSYNTYANAGLLNREEFAKMSAENKEQLPAVLQAAGAWETVFGNDVTQPLFISNVGLNGKAYGYIGSSTSLSQDYNAVSLRVKTTPGSVASIYLMDMEDSTRQTVLSVDNKLTFWYDANGNVCTGDPTKNSSSIAFFLDKNGLYKANKNWEGYDKLGALKDEYFANLSAYTYDAQDKVLRAAADSAAHDYEDYTWNRETFYQHSDGAFYTAKDGGVKVNDLASLTNSSNTGVLKARFLAADKQYLQVENLDTNGAWVTVTFYLRKGVSAKNYRLEVWSGNRWNDSRAKGNSEGYVAFDTNYREATETTFSDVIDYYEDKADMTFKGVFSYYDTDKHVRYDADRDEDKSGNVYADNIKAKYEASAEGVAFLKYEDANEILFLADYSLSDQTVAAKEITEDTETEDETEEEEEENEVNVWLLASSIAVAGVLVLAVASILVRKIVEKARKKNGTRVRKAKDKKSAKKVEKSNVEDDSPYND